MTMNNLSGWEGKEKFSIKSSRSSQSWVNGIDPISCSNDNNLPTAVQTIHEGEKSGHNGGVDLVLSAGTNRGQPIDLIKEYD